MRFVLATTLALTPLMAKNNEPVQQLDEAAVVISEIMAAPDRGIPQELIENAHCITRAVTAAPSSSRCTHILPRRTIQCAYRYPSSSTA